VIYKSSIDATTALMGGHVDVVVTPTSTFVPVLGTGKIRIIAIAAPQRVADRFATVPTWKEQGANVNVSSFRMLLGAKALTASHIAFWDATLSRVAKSDTWKKEVDDNEWENLYYPSAETRKFLDAQQAQYRAALTDVGLIK
jgi:putative tricarboxylic transport membrane protein